MIMGSIFFGRMQKSTYFSMKCLICGYLSNSIVVVVIDASTDVCYQERNHSFHLAIQMNEKKSITATVHVCVVVVVGNSLHVSTGASALLICLPLFSFYSFSSERMNKTWNWLWFAHIKQIYGHHVKLCIHKKKYIFLDSGQWCREKDRKMHRINGYWYEMYGG